MKKLLLFSFLLISFFGLSQNCKFKINEIDDFTKSRVLETNPRIIASEFSGHSIVLQFIYNKSIDINIELSLSQHFSVITDESSYFQFLMNDGKILTFNINKITSGNLKGSGLMATTELSFNFPTSEEELEYIKSVGINKIRFESTDLKKDFIVSNKKHVEKINFIIQCFLNEIKKNK